MHYNHAYILYCKLLKDKIQAQDTDSDILSFHCILHQKSLIKVALFLKYVADPIASVVETIREGHSTTDSSNLFLGMQIMKT